MKVSDDNSINYEKLRDDNLDLGILAKGGISLYFNMGVLDYDLKLLSEKRYNLIEFDGTFITSAIELHFDLQQKLKFPGYYGRNFDALVDCLRDFKADENGTALIFRKLNALNLKSLVHLLDIFSNCSRSELVYGRKLIVLIQVDNKKFNIPEPIGSINFRLWNDKEWFESDRR
ncbi:MAG TPA: barstar family protein [Cyclobacteriaceae bacterium]|jgi:RNAse (barnase) inhibitor barstar|nr:barstar family protein [Cyclobacteriaceae bacterium]